jgi:hypothetical protein
MKDGQPGITRTVSADTLNKYLWQARFVSRIEDVSFELSFKRLMRLTAKGYALNIRNQNRNARAATTIQMPL